jgi:hypothetical protein
MGSEDLGDAGGDASDAAHRFAAELRETFGDRATDIAAAQVGSAGSREAAAGWQAVLRALAD